MRPAIKRILLCLLITGVFECALSHHLRHHNSNAADLKSLAEPSEETYTSSPKNRRSLQPGFYNKNGSEADKGKIPYSYKKLDKMMKKAILQIILGDLHPADMLLLKALNYTLEEVMAIREHELIRIKEEEAFEARARKQQEQELLSAKYQAAMHRRSSAHQRKKTGQRESSFEAYNKQAVYDYENGPVASSSSTKLDYDESKITDDNDKSAVVTEESFRQRFNRNMESHVVFKIRYDDSEFDSGSDERSRMTGLKNHRTKTILKLEKPKSADGSFQVSGTDNERPDAAAASSALEDNLEVDGSTRSSDFEEFNRQAILDYENLVPGGKLGLDLDGDGEDNEAGRDDKDFAEMAKKKEREFSNHEEFERALNGSGLEDVEQRRRNESATTETDDYVHKKNEKSEKSEEQIGKENEEKQEEETTSKKRVSEYEGLEWVGGDVYRVIPEAMEALMNYEDELAAASAAAADYHEDEDDDLRRSSNIDDVANDTYEYQNDAADSSAMYPTNFTSNQNLTSYQRLAMAQRRDGNLTSTFDSQGQKAIEDIKLRVLAMTGRFNLTSNNNQVQRERLTMFSPICQMPRNTDAEAWADPFSMNMHFQLNLTSGEHVLAAKLRLYKLPQDSASSPSSGSSTTYEEDEEDEKKIRVSVYFYTKSLKKHRAKKRLMDSIVTSLTSQGSHLALDVRQSLRFWRPNSPQQHGHANNTNHGLVVQVEDQDGKPLKPSLYIQEPSCHSSSSDSDSNQKTYSALPFSSEPVLVTFAS